MEKAIILENVSYQYPKGDKPVLNKISLTVEKGSFVAVLGPTGAGKTTLSLCLNGLIPQLLEGEVSGKVIVAGKDLSRFSVQQMSKDVGLVLQDPETQIFGMTVQEDTAFGPRNLCLSKAEIWLRVKEALDKVKMKGYEARSTAELSGGEKQRLAIAGVLAMQPEILVLDEPASELDPAGREEIYEIIDQLRRERDLTIVVVEQFSEEIIDRADEVVILGGGEIGWRGKPREIFRDVPKLREFGIKPLPVTSFGWNLYQRGMIGYDEIPLDIASAVQVAKELGDKQERFTKGRFTKGVSFVTVQDSEEESGDKKPALLEVSNLNYIYASGHTALKNVNLRVHQGEFLALAGENGAGKTTLAKHFNGLLKPANGDVVVAGMNTKVYDTPQLAQIVGYVFQNPDHQIFSVSVEKEIEYGLQQAGIPEAEVKHRVEEVLRFTDLERFRDCHPFTLGKGERQMIAVASILALRPKILVIDEPTTGLDWAGVEKLMSLIKRLNEEGTTIIMISHDMEVVAKYAKRVIVMKDGEISIDGSTREVFSNFEILKDACIVPPQICRLSAHLEQGFFPTLLNDEEITGFFCEK